MKLIGKIIYDIPKVIDPILINLDSLDMIMLTSQKNANKENVSVSISLIQLQFR